MKENIADYINVLSDFCGKRDIPELTKNMIKSVYGIEQADVMVLFGGSILCGGDVLANAIKNNIAKKYIIVGGAGHTTETLRVKMNEEIPQLNIAKLTESEIFELYIEHKYNLKVDFLECNSTNCGNNITNLLKLLDENNILFKSIIISQDATMQRRMEAVLRKYVSDSVIIINYAVYSAKVAVKESKLVFEEEIRGMWDMNRYITLLMGEIPRLSDNSEGYGPNGRNFIVHVDIPKKVEIAFEELKKEYADLIRRANPLYASNL